MQQMCSCQRGEIQSGDLYLPRTDSRHSFFIDRKYEHASTCNLSRFCPSTSSKSGASVSQICSICRVQISVRDGETESKLKADKILMRGQSRLQRQSKGTSRRS